ncbi:unnamed protein product [Lactuca saligna]|uniref:Uncharacterized protein n=1 Tax=Lactuca saligna TaxID=75948 RepID=A0AA35YFE2_LACSI|nr:unnamed protein product [Lactuca saligna]
MFNIPYGLNCVKYQKGKHENKNAVKLVLLPIRGITTVCCSPAISNRHGRDKRTTTIYTAVVIDHTALYYTVCSFFERTLPETNTSAPCIMSSLQFHSGADPHLNVALLLNLLNGNFVFSIHVVSDEDEVICGARA